MILVFDRMIRERGEKGVVGAELGGIEQLA